VERRRKHGKHTGKNRIRHSRRTRPSATVMAILPALAQACIITAPRRVVVANINFDDHKLCMMRVTGIYHPRGVSGEYPTLELESFTPFE
jgi:hypothetical protein